MRKCIQDVSLSDPRDDLKCMSFKIPKKYEYSLLSEQEDIRLVEFPPRDADGVSDLGESDILINIVHESIDKCEYEALSYVWGQEASGEFQVQVGGLEFRLIEVTKNLYNALKHLQGSQKRKIWIDALCINQKDLEERNKQVQRMSEIYRKARKVTIWLGNSKEDSDAAFDFMEKIQVQDLDWSSTDMESGRSWQALAALMRRPWFSRRWVIQEVAFAREANLQCGTKSIGWSEFCEVVTLFEEKSFQIRHVLQNYGENSAVSRTTAIFVIVGVLELVVAPNRFLQRVLIVLVLMVISADLMSYLLSMISVALESKTAPWEDELPIGEFQPGGAHALVKTLGHVLRKNGSDKAKPEWTTERLLFHMTAFQAKDRHDILYAVKDLSSDSLLGLDVNYDRTIKDLYSNVVKKVVERSGSLNIICRPWAMEPDLTKDPDLTKESTSLPTWIRPLSDAAFAPDSQGVFRRRNADLLVGPPHKRVYNATGSFVASPGPYNGSHISCKGFYLPEIAWLGDEAANGTIPKSWRPELKRKFPDSWLKDSYWRVLLANRDHAGELPDLWYRRACNELLDKSKDENLNIGNRLKKLVEKESSMPSLQAKLLRRLQSTVWNRRLVVLKGPTTLEEYYVGLVPKNTREDDRICILYGCDVPVILRKYGDTHYQFVGEAFVHGQGVMEGDVTHLSAKTEQFDLI